MVVDVFGHADGPTSPSRLCAGGVFLPLPRPFSGIFAIMRALIRLGASPSFSARGPLAAGRSRSCSWAAAATTADADGPRLLDTALRAISSRSLDVTVAEDDDIVSAKPDLGQMVRLLLSTRHRATPRPGP